jgi:hypothetical protein
MRLASSTHEELQKYVPVPFPQSKRLSKISIPRWAIGYFWHKIGTLAKFYAIAFVADAEYQREHNFGLAKNPKIGREAVKIILDGIWVAAKTAQSFLLPYFLVS